MVFPWLSYGTPQGAHDKFMAPASHLGDVALAEAVEVGHGRVHGDFAHGFQG